MKINVCDICHARDVVQVAIPSGKSTDPASGKTETDQELFDLCTKHLKQMIDGLIEKVAFDHAVALAESWKRRRDQRNQKP